MELDPLNELLAVNFAGNLSARGEADRASELLNKLITFRPDSTMLLRSLATQEMFHGNLVEGFRLALRAHSLQPEDPQDISALAQAWLNLDAPDEAEEVLRKGLEIHPNNFNLQNVYWQILVAQGRHEETRSLANSWLQEFGDNAPPFVSQVYNTQMGMASFQEGDLTTATQYLTAALESDESGKYDQFRMFVVTMAAEANRRLGNSEETARLLDLARRDIQRARVNGVDNPDIYYSETVVLAMDGQRDAAVAKLQEAYDGGFRLVWLLQIDPRIDSIRDDPEFLVIRANIDRDVQAAREEVRLLASL